MPQVEILSQFLVAPFGKTKLRHVVPTIVTEVNDTAGLHLVRQFLHDLGVLFGRDGREDEEKEAEGRCVFLKRQRVVD